MSKLLRLLGWLALGILGSLIAYYLSESALFAPLKQHNPIDTAAQWLSSPVSTPRILWLSALVWSLATIPSAIFIWFVIRRKKLSDTQVVIEAIGPAVPWDFKKGKARDTKKDT